MKKLDWKNLSFGYIKTNFNMRCEFKNGKWGNAHKSRSELIPLHMASTCLHYGQEAFEGLKAFSGKDKKIRIFRWEENFKRLNESAKEIFMPEIPKNIFRKMIFSAVRANRDFVPPYESGASLYIRPLLIGTGAEVGLNPAKEYLFIVFVTPVGPYFKEGFKPLDFYIDYDRDRAAPLGTGHVKVGGNYASSLKSIISSHKKGYGSVIFLDPKEKKYIDECGPANFFAIKNNKYITPDSKSILPSITNKSLIELAKDMGMKIEKRKIKVTELSTFDEVGACGTAAIIGPAAKIVDGKTKKTYIFCKDNKPGPVCEKLYNRLRAIQYGDEIDKFKWISTI